jgi:hypothetical protein
MAPMWGNTDTTGNSAIFAPAQVHKAPTAVERGKLYGNTTANGYGTSETVGQFGVSPDEIRAKRADRLPKPPSAGWVLKQTGQGGRAGRVKYETLVAMHSIAAGGGGDEDVSFPDFSINLSINPVSTVGDAWDDEIAVFNANAYNTPSGGSLTYKWQKWGGSAFANVDNGGAYSNTATKQLSVLANTVAANAEIYRAGVYQSGATTKYSTNATLTVHPLIVIGTQPVSTSANSSADAIAKFTVAVTTVPTGKAVTYAWQKWGGASFANVAAAGAYSNVTTAELSVLANVAANAEVYRVGVYAATNKASNAFSSNAVITITT